MLRYLHSIDSVRYRNPSTDTYHESKIQAEGQIAACLLLGQTIAVPHNQFAKASLNSTAGFRKLVVGPASNETHRPSA